VFATFEGKPRAGRYLLLNHPENRAPAKRGWIGRGMPYRLFSRGRVAETQRREALVTEMLII
jgi:hypothetical protein